MKSQRTYLHLKVVTKFILKSKIYKENWVEDSKYAYGRIPLECSILCKLDHTNIIKVLEVFQNEDHVQMIMEKHGGTLDVQSEFGKGATFIMHFPLND